MSPAPTVGQTILARMDPAVNNGADVAPAVITRVWSRCADGSWTVNVKVLADAPDNEWRTSVSLFPDQAAADEVKPHGLWVGWWPAA